ncbi:tetratricopeptide repeat protein [Psychromonas sp. SR45-3]|uniref:tetratricopeptide repeat protein n=1 Tax=Psychromonas sp. SR45-3 TaxID=2760930 RepID=UPI0015F7BA53|nr:tetratricopeptide repeat protein [Psychromonas sp. SR45-3]MBB1274244.1 tetratricopeptide repeat protein [Psychromonas sp. SR45-3]
MQADIFDVTVQDFQTIIAQGSVNKPVLAVFWSSQCTICGALLPLLEQLQREHANGFTLAKINCETEQQIVQHFEIKSVPTVYMFVNGQGVDGFAGEQTTDFINNFIKKHLPDPALALLGDAQTLFAQGKLGEAKATIIQAQKLSPEDNQIKLATAQIYLALGEFENAKPILAAIPMADQNMIYHNLMSELQLAEQSAQTPEITALENALMDAADKQPIQYQLAIQYHQAKRFSEALALLYSLLCHDLGYENGDAKKNMLDILASVDDAALVSEYRRKLYSLLY